MKKKNLLCAIEGVDASGKNTQAALLAKRIKKEVKDLAVVRDFPQYNNSSGKIIKKLLNDPESSHIPDKAFILQSLMTINRYEEIPEIKQLLENKVNVVLDRYYISGLVYGKVSNADYDFLIKVNSLLPQPDLCILVDIPVELSLERRKERRDAFETNVPFLEKIREEYLRYFTENNHVIISGNRSVNEVHDDIWKVWLEHYEL